MSPRALLRQMLTVLCPVMLGACCEITGECQECDSAPAANTLSNSFNTYAATGAPVASFRLTQDHQSAGSGCAPAGGSAVALSVTSIASVPLRFDYLVQGVGATGLVVWSRSGSVPRLAPGQSLDVGQVARTPVRVDVGARAILTNIAVVQ
ncbi:MAG: hypothetical protein IT360_18980 [Gemmatimonadaceae bacterium]|nr:hypothetical protein [Gemmatimonadaceae bacterium]